MTMIIGIDPGTRLAGAALLHEDDRIEARLWVLDGPLDERLHALARHIDRLCFDLRASGVMMSATGGDVLFAVEQPMGGLKGWGDEVRYAYGVVLSVLWGHRWIPISPSIGKQTLTGRGNADKDMMIAACSDGIIEASPNYWLAMLNPHNKLIKGRPMCQTLARDMAATIADAYGIALAGKAKLVAS